VFGSFSAGDSLRVYRLQRKGISLDLQGNLTQPTSPLKEAWLAFLTQQAMGQPTYVLYDLRDGEGFIQVRYRPHQAAADVTYLAPSLPSSSRAADTWSHLLDGAGIEAAGRGIQRMLANLPESGEVDIFQQAGFTLYASEDIYRLHPPASDPGAGQQLALRPQRPEDWPAIQKLCVTITPQRVRQAEGGIALATSAERNRLRYVLPGENGDDLMAALSVNLGKTAHWVRLLVHPAARQAAKKDAVSLSESLLRWVLGELASRPVRAIYCNVRQYESGVRDGLQAVGFEPYATRALMVKHTLAWLKTPAPETVPVLKSSAEPVPPAYRINGEAELQAPNGRLAARRDA
jgi:hypothetical protein